MHIASANRWIVLLVGLLTLVASVQTVRAADAAPGSTSAQEEPIRNQGDGRPGKQPHKARDAGEAQSGLSMIGVNISGMEGGFFTVPTHASVDYWIGKGANVFRLPFKWERVQPELRGPLDMTGKTGMPPVQDLVAYITSKGAKVILDVHNYARYDKQPMQADEEWKNSFADFWGKLASLYRNDPNVIFGIMNEPGNHLSWLQWSELQNAAIASIRHAGAKQLILVQGAKGDQAGNLPKINGPLFFQDIVDPGSNWMLEGHQYFDKNSSGTKGPVKWATSPIEALTMTTNWARSHNLKLFLGEFGMGSDETSQQALSYLMEFLQKNSDVWAGATLWGGGNWPARYPLRAEPVKGVEQPHANILFSSMRQEGARAVRQAAAAFPLELSANATFNQSGFFSGPSLSGGYGVTQRTVISTYTKYLVIEARVKVAAAPGAARSACGYDKVLSLGIAADGKATAAYGFGKRGVTLDSDVNIADGRPHHIELNLTPEGAMFFVDGVLAAKNSSTLQDTGVKAGLTGFAVGARYKNELATQWQGEIDEVAVWQIARHSSNFTPPREPYSGDEKGLVKVWHLDGNGD